MASCTTSPTPMETRPKWWLAFPWSSTRSCRSTGLTRYNTHTHIRTHQPIETPENVLCACPDRKQASPAVRSLWFEISIFIFFTLSTCAPMCQSYVFKYIFLHQSNTWTSPPPRGLCCHVRKNGATEASHRNRKWVCVTHPRRGSAECSSSSSSSHCVW